MKIKKNAFEKNGRIMMTVLASFLTLLAVSTVDVQKKIQKKRNRVSKRQLRFLKKKKKRKKRKL